MQSQSPWPAGSSAPLTQGLWPRPPPQSRHGCDPLAASGASQPLSCPSCPGRHVPLRRSHRTPPTSKPPQGTKSLHQTSGTRARWLFPQPRLQGLGMRFNCGNRASVPPGGEAAAASPEGGRGPQRARRPARPLRAAAGAAEGRSGRVWAGRAGRTVRGELGELPAVRPVRRVLVAAAAGGWGALAGIGGAAGGRGRRPVPARGRCEFCCEARRVAAGCRGWQLLPGQKCGPPERVPPPLPPSAGGSRVARRSRRSVFPAAAGCGGQGGARLPVLSRPLSQRGRSRLRGRGAPARAPARRAGGQVPDRPVFTAGTCSSVLRCCWRVFARGLLPNSLSCSRDPRREGCVCVEGVCAWLWVGSAGSLGEGWVFGVKSF